MAMTDPENVQRDEFREWAERNNFGVIEQQDSEEIIAKAGGGLEIHLTKYGNVHLVKHNHLGGESGEITFGEKRMVVENGRGERFHVGPGESPI